MCATCPPLFSSLPPPRNFDALFPVFQHLIKSKNPVPFCICGGSYPDLSEEQDERILKGMGAKILLPKKTNPYTLSLPAAKEEAKEGDGDKTQETQGAGAALDKKPVVSKCNHIIVARGGTGSGRSKRKILVARLGWSLVPRKPHFGRFDFARLFWGILCWTIFRNEFWELDAVLLVHIEESPHIPYTHAQFYPTAGEDRAGRRRCADFVITSD